MPPSFGTFPRKWDRMQNQSRHYGVEGEQREPFTQHVILGRLVLTGTRCACTAVLRVRISCCPLVVRLSLDHRNDPDSGESYGRWLGCSSVEEQPVYIRCVVGSTPTNPLVLHHRRLAQLGERHSYKLEVTGSSPVSPMRLTLFGYEAVA